MWCPREASRHWLFRSGNHPEGREVVNREAYLQALLVVLNGNGWGEVAFQRVHRTPRINRPRTRLRSRMHLTLWGRLERL